QLGGGRRVRLQFAFSGGLFGFGDFLIDVLACGGHALAQRRELFLFRLVDKLFVIGFAKEGQRPARRSGRRFGHGREGVRALHGRRRIDVLIVEIIELRRAIGVLWQLQALQVFVGHVFAVRGQVVILPVGYAFEFTESERAREQVFDVDGRFGVVRQLIGGL